MLQLTRREAQVVSLIARGRRCADIARELGITLSTTRKHRSNIAAKFRLHTTAQVASFAIRAHQDGIGTMPRWTAIEALSNREKEILDSLASGLTHKQIARCLVISPRTVGKHVENIRHKTGARTIATLIDLSLRFDGHSKA
jgi:DNA-binding CsgD family transcriptional regulator